MYYGLLALSGAAVSYFVAKVVSSIAVFPGQLFAKPKSMQHFQSVHPGHTLTFSEERTNQNRILQTVKIEPANTTGSVIIIFNGQNATFRNEKKLSTYCQLAKDTGHTVIGFDYGGTGTRRISTWTHHALVNDGLYLARKFTKNMSENGALILKGNSLGGAIATKVVKRCHDPDVNIKAYLWNGRSFQSTSAAAAGHIRTLQRSGHYENKLTSMIYKGSQHVFSFILRLTQFEIDAAEDYKKIPTAYKNYYIVRSNKQGRCKNKDDVMIPHCATFEVDSEIKLDVKDTIARGDKTEPSDIAYYRERRKVISKQPENAHATPETELFCRKEINLSAYKLFCAFSTEYIKKHETNRIKESHSSGRTVGTISV